MEPDLQFAEDPIISTSPPQNRIEFSPAYHDDDNEFGMDSSFQDQVCSPTPMIFFDLWVTSLLTLSIATTQLVTSIHFDHAFVFVRVTH
jgi:hypothetical protein